MLNYVCVCLCGYGQVSTDAFGDQKMVSGPMELELYVGVNYHTWVLETKLVPKSGKCH